jgi:hypothetical protein
MRAQACGHRWAQTIERAHRVGRQVDIGAHAGITGRLFVNRDRMTLSLQGDGRSQAANAAAHKTDIQ